MVEVPWLWRRRRGRGLEGPGFVVREGLRGAVSVVGTDRSHLAAAYCCAQDLGRPSVRTSKPERGLGRWPGCGEGRSFGGKPEALEDAAGDGEVGDQGDEPAAAATVGAGEDVDRGGACFILHLLAEVPVYGRANRRSLELQPATGSRSRSVVTSQLAALRSASRHR